MALEPKAIVCRLEQGEGFAWFRGKAVGDWVMFKQPTH
jgi:hypothetical protein